MFLYCRLVILQTKTTNILLKRRINSFFKSEVFYHTAFWIIHVIFRLYLRGYFQSFHSETLFEEFFTLPVRMFGTYFTIFLLKKYLFNKEYLRFFLLVPLSMFIILFIRRLVGYYLIEPILYPDLVQADLDNLYSIIKYTVYVYPVISMAVLITILRKWFSDQAIRRKLERENLTAQLQLLKRQLQPHFLFNTLNNIYSMAVDKSERTPESILKLSDLLDYMLYKTNSPVVSLDDEIKHLKDYIELEKLRYGNRLEVNFKVSGNTKNVLIAPLLFLPLLENCFKHGASKIIDNSWVSVDFQVDGKVLTCKFENSKESGEAKNYSEGIGLKNVNERLRLLYNNHYEIKILEEKELFLVILKLDTTHKPTSISL